MGLMAKRMADASSPGSPARKTKRDAFDGEPSCVTQTWTLPSDATREELLRHDGLRSAASMLARGEVVAFPTETVYGLGGDCTNDAAIANIYRAKGRPSDNPLIAHVCDDAQVDQLVSDVPSVARTLMKAFWPGPLTIVLPVRKGKVSVGCTAGLDTVAVRMPNHPVALALIELSGCALAAPSANTSGRPSPTVAAHVAEDLNGRVAGLLDAGAAGVGLESTVIDCATLVAERKLTLLRPGGVTRRMIEQALREAHPEFVVQSAGETAVKEKEAPRAPGMKYTHYAPRATLHLVRGNVEFLRDVASKSRAAGKRVGIMCAEEDQAALVGASDVLLPCGRRAAPESVAARLFAVLRDFDGLPAAEAVECIYCQDFSAALGEETTRDGLGEAIANRLSKAAGGSVIVQEQAR